MNAPASLAAPPRGAYSELPELIRLRHGARDLKLRQQRQAFSPLVGPHHTRFRGRGIEFEEVRLYQSGDDIRSIDWRVTARTGKPHTKLFREERERPVLLLVDQGLSMFFGSKTCCKSVTAAHIAALLAWAAIQGNDRVGGLVYNDTDHAEVRPKRQARTVLELLSSIHRFNLLLQRQPPPATTGLNRALEELRRITRPGSNLFLISDFQGLGEEGEKHLFQLSRHNDISAIQVYDPLEQQLPPDGAYSITNGRDRSLLLTGDQALRRHFQENFSKKTALLKERLGPMGIPLLQVSTLESPLYYFRNLLGKR